MEEHRIIRACPQAETCFGCRNDAVEGVGTRAYITEDNYVVGLITTKECHQGFPGVIHGGIIGVYFDEVLWHLYEFIDPKITVMTLSITVDYHVPVPPGVNIRVVGRIDEIKGRKFTAIGKLLLPTDQIAADCKLLYIGIKTETVDNLTEKESNRVRKLFENTDVESVRF